MDFTEHQSKLPRLPIPSLRETTDKLLLWSKSLLTEEEQKESEKAVESFLNNKKQGDALQKLLIEYDKNTKYGTYFEEFWNEAYLAPNASVVLNLNPFFVLEDDPTPGGNDQVVRASSLVFSSLKFVSDLRRGQLAPDIIGRKKNIGLCMSQFKRLFSTARIPTENCDRIESDDQATHVIVLRQGQFYYFDALWPTGEVAISQVELARNFHAILNDASDCDSVRSAMRSVGVLTATTRDQWAKTRTSMIQFSKQNQEVFQIIDTALFVVCLDDCSPETIDDRAANMLHGSYHLVPHTSAHEGVLQTGTLTNRWYDKLQLIICENGAAGINFEHSAVDGHTVLRFASDVFADTIVSFARSITKDTHGAEYLDPVVGKGNFFKKPPPPSATTTTSSSINATFVDFSPKKMEFDLDMEHLKDIHYSETSISDQVLQNEMRVLEFSTFGKRWIKNKKISPDSFVQVAMCKF
jgi:carnitine O-acetyltransferase